MFIVFEGTEGSGKSTQARLLAERLAASGIAHVLTREPGGTRLGEALRHQVLHVFEQLPAETELLLMLAARSAHVLQVVVPGLAAGQVIVSDRYELSSLAYQGVGRGLGVERVQELNTFATGGLKPDLTVVLDVPVEVGVARRGASRTSNDRIESAGHEFHCAVSEAYRLLANGREVVLVDGTAPAPVVERAVLELLRQRFPDPFGRLTD